MIVGLIIILQLVVPPSPQMLIAKPGRPDDIHRNFHFTQRIYFNNRPVRGEKTLMTYEILPKEYMDSIWVEFHDFQGIQPLSDDTILRFDARPGVTAKFYLNLRFYDTPAFFEVAIHRNNTYGQINTRFTRYLMDVYTGAYGSLKEIQFRRPVEYRFNPNSRKFEQEIYGFEPNRWQKNREIIDTLRTMASNLSDSICLILFADAFKILWRVPFRTWQDKANFLLEQGWVRNKTGAERDTFVINLVAKMGAERIQQEKTEEHMQILSQRREVLSWVKPTAILVVILGALLYYNARKKSRKVTPKIFDRIITYLIYAFVIGAAFYIARPYLFVRIEREKYTPPAMRHTNLKSKPVESKYLPASEEVIKQLYMKFSEAGLDSEYAYEHLHIVQVNQVKGPITFTDYPRWEARLTVASVVEGLFKLTTDVDWIDNLNDNEGLYVFVVYEFDVVHKKLGRFIRFTTDRQNHRDYIITPYSLKPIKNLISYDDARKKIFDQLTDEERVPYFSIRLDLTKKPDPRGNYIFLCGAGYKVDLETGTIEKETITINTGL
jgi:hypothetical protein